MLERTWRQAAMRASGVTLVVPAGLAVGIALTVSVGGGTTGLSQVLAGPSVPAAAERQIASAGPSGGPILPAIPRARASERPRTRRSTAPARSQRTERAPQRDARRAEPPPREPREPQAERPGTPSRPSRPATPSVPAPSPPAEPAAPAAPAAPSDPVRDLGTGVANTVGQVPVVGPPVAGVVQTVVDLLAPPR